MGKHRSFIAARPVRPEDYSPGRLFLWNQTAEAAAELGNPLPQIYPGSIYAKCDTCGIEVAVGPRQQLIMDVSTVVCLLCAAGILEDAKDSDTVSARLVDLGNPEDPSVDKHLTEKLLKPMALVGELQREGKNAYLAFVNTDLNAPGFTITCSCCGRKSKSSTEPPPTAVILCPNCQPRRG